MSWGDWRTDLDEVLERPLSDVTGMLEKANGAVKDAKYEHEETRKTLEMWKKKQLRLVASKQTIEELLEKEKA